MTLSNQDEEDPEKFEGPGEIRFDEDGHLEVVLYDPAYEVDLPSEFSSEPAGSWMGPSQMFDLEATDLSGAVWTADNLRPDSKFYVGRPGAVVRARLHSISKATMADREGKDFAWLFFSQRIDTPANVSTITTVQEGKRPPRRGFQTDVWDVDCAPFETFTLRRGDSGFEINVVAEAGTLSQGLDTRIEEAIWFALGQPIVADVVQTRRGDSKRIVIESRGHYPRLSSATAPYSLSHHDAAGPVGAILCKYMQYVMEEGRARYHPLSVLLRNVLGASDRTVEEYALEVCVAVEGIVHLAFPDLGEPAEEVIEAVDDVESTLGAVLEESVLSDRLKGFLRAVRRPSPRAALKELAQQRVISQEQVDAWEKLRHVSAHGMEHDLPFRELYEATVRVRVMMTRLVLHIIGYEGQYTDYGSLGYPTRQMVEEASAES